MGFAMFSPTAARAGEFHFTLLPRVYREKKKNSNMNYEMHSSYYSFIEF